jgi:hypothetical protein
MDHKITYNKDQKLEEIDDKIAEILSEALFSYMIRKGLLKRRLSSNPGAQKRKP